MAYRFNVNIPRTRLRQPPLYRKNNSIAALLPSRKDISYIATTSTEITCGGSAVIRASYSWNIVSGGIVVSDPVILLKLDENTGTNTVDSFGNWSLENFNNNSGWTTGPTAITGNVSALQFNQGINTNEFLYFSTPKNFPYGNNYTLATWVKIDDIAFAGFQVMFHIKASAIITFAPYKVVATCVPIVMILTGFIAGITSDKFFQGRRGPIVFFSFLGQFIMLLALYLSINNPWAASICLILLLGFIQGGHCLIAATAAMDFGGRKAAATAAGFIDGMQYLSGAFVGYGMGRLLDFYKAAQVGQEFTMWPLAPLIPSVIGIVLSISIWNAKATNEH
jgi:hypothetical protein